jgi:opacity protein-like surface antigen
MDDLNLDKLMRKGLHREYPVDENLRAEMWKAMPIAKLPFWKRWRFYAWSLLALLLVFLTYQLIPDTLTEMAKTEQVELNRGNNSSERLVQEGESRKQVEILSHSEELSTEEKSGSRSPNEIAKEGVGNQNRISETPVDSIKDKQRPHVPREQRAETKTIQKEFSNASSKDEKHKKIVEANSPAPDQKENIIDQAVNSKEAKASNGKKQIGLNEKEFGFVNNLLFKPLSLNLWWEELPFEIESVGVKHLSRTAPTVNYKSPNKWSIGVNGRASSKAGDMYLHETGDSGLSADPITIGASFYYGSELEIRRYMGDFYMGSGLGLTKSKQKLGITNTTSDSLFASESRFILLAQDVPYENRIISYVKEYTEEVYVGDTTTESKLERDLNFTYLHIPVVVGYEKMLGKWGVNTNLGANFMFFRSSNLNDFSETRLSRQVNLDYKLQNQTNTFVSLGASYAISNRCSLGVDYRFDQFWKEKSDGLNNSWIRHSAQIGLRYSFFGP